MPVSHPPRNPVFGLLLDFYEEPDRHDLNEAIALLRQRNGLKKPKIVWCRPRSIDGGRSWGVTVFTGPTDPPDASIRLLHPRRWAKLTNPFTPEVLKLLAKAGLPKTWANAWVVVTLHEFGHWDDWKDMERRADAFAVMMVRCGL